MSRIIIIILALLGNIISNSYFLLKFSIKIFASKSNKINKCTSINILAILIYASNIISVIYAFIVKTAEFDEESIEYRIKNSIANILLIIPYSLVYVFGILRLYFVFNESIFKVSNTTLNIHTIIGITVSMWNLVYWTLIGIDSDKIEQIYIKIYGSIGMCVYIIGFISMTVLFNFNLFRVVSTQRRSIIMIEDKLSDHQISLVNIITKQSLLNGCTAVIIIMHICSYIISHIIRFSNPMFELWCTAVYWCMFIFSGLCVYLSFKINALEYKLCCNICDKTCQMICQNCAEKRIKKISVDTDASTNQLI